MPPRANVSLPDGTKIEFEGSLEELQALTEHIHNRSMGPPSAKAAHAGNPSSSGTETGHSAGEEPDVARIVGIIKDCAEAETIEAKVLANRDALNRVLMCLWVVHKYVNPMMGLTSGDIERITDQLGVRIGISHASVTLSEKARAYVTADSVRRQGAPVRYRLNRRGVQFFEELLAGPDHRAHNKKEWANGR